MIFEILVLQLFFNCCFFYNLFPDKTKKILDNIQDNFKDNVQDFKQMVNDLYIDYENSYKKENIYYNGRDTINTNTNKTNNINTTNTINNKVYDIESQLTQEEEDSFFKIELNK